MLKDKDIQILQAGERQYRVSDSDGLYLQVSVTGRKLWRLKYRFAGKQKMIALGTYPATSLKDAREKHYQAKKLLEQGLDPGEKKKIDKAAAVKASREASNTFKVVARQWLEKRKSDLTKKYIAKITRCLDTDLYPTIGSTPITLLTPKDILLPAEAAQSKGQLVKAHKIVQIAGQVLEDSFIRGDIPIGSL
ncbi:MAG: integrase arm-type DNA-binding domain-containing protein [Desulfovibrio sp.]|jgi:hypothetical protein|nr:integrase arm-type DNA-binding domain-containing protein [Desulfovibrio sp.]